MAEERPKRKPGGRPRGPVKGCPPNKGAGRKEIPIDWDKVGLMLEAGCLGTEIAGEFNCHPDTIYNRCVEELGIKFSEFTRQKKNKGDGSLRIRQFREAMKGDKTLLIWLGKQRIGQRETPLETQDFNGKLGDLLDMLMKMKKDSDENV